MLLPVSSAFCVLAILKTSARILPVLHAAQCSLFIELPYFISWTPFVQLFSEVYSLKVDEWERPKGR